MHEHGLEFDICNNLSAIAKLLAIFPQKNDWMITCDKAMSFEHFLELLYSTKH